jgi:3-dehydroquinate synthase
MKWTFEELPSMVQDGRSKAMEERGKPYTSNIIVTGFMGTGKTSVARALAELLGMTFVDVDEEIEKRAGMSVSGIFSSHGEARFRLLEKQVCKETFSMTGSIIATGGGTPLDPENRALMSVAGMVVSLSCSMDELRRRLKHNTTRPLLSPDPESGDLKAIYDLRRKAYDAFPFTVDTTNLSIRETASRIRDLWTGSGTCSRSRVIRVPGGQDYTMYFAPGALGTLGGMLANRNIESKVAVVSDAHVAGLYLNKVLESLRGSGLQPFSVVVPPGERTKNLHHASLLYQKFVQGGLDRRGAVVALGGGVVGDLAGFAAATFMRGVAFVQCPTTVLAMVDSSIGGKTGLDTEQGKNLIGAFKHPIAVCGDIQTLQTLDATEIRCGLAESIKHAVIGDEGLLGRFEDESPDRALDPENLARSVDVKRRIVETDPYEDGPRELLNLGHTLGHAMEAHAKYSVRHGEAVSLGMVASARISRRLGICPLGVIERIESVLRKVGLPVRHVWDPGKIVRFLSTDKKSVRGTPRFVLIRDVGKVEHGWNVDLDLVKEALEEMRGN